MRVGYRECSLIMIGQGDKESRAAISYLYKINSRMGHDIGGYLPISGRQYTADPTACFQHSIRVGKEP